MTDPFTLDLRSALSRTSDGLMTPQSGDGSFALSGLYACQAEGADIEIEFTEQSSLSRSVICLTGGHSVFLRLPDGTYGAHYRWLTPPRPNTEVTLNIAAQGAGQRLGLYARKALQLVRRPQAWLGTLKYLVSQPSPEFGLRLSVAPPLAAQAQMRPGLQPALTSEPYKVSIIIPTKDRHDLLKACVASLDRLKGVVTELIIVDNGATLAEAKAFLDQLNQRPDTRVLRHDIPFNFSRLCNLGAAAARHPYLLFLNDDIEALDNSWLKAMCGFGARDDTGVVGARLLYPSGDLQHGGIAANLIPGPGHPWRGAPESVWRGHGLLDVSGEVDAVTGACLLIGKPLFERLNGFDETSFAITLNDVDLCLRVRETGLKVVYVPEATLVHKESQSRRPDDVPEERSRRQVELAAFLKRHPKAARTSVFYPAHLRRDTDSGATI